MPYDRKNALKYARTYWNQVSSDGYVGIKSGNGYESVPLGRSFVQAYDEGLMDETIERADGTLIPWAELEDCAHFISCCLGKPPGGGAGGLPIKSDFPNGPYGKLSAQALYDYLVANQLVQIVADKKSHAQTQPLLGQLAEGDLIFYYDAARSRYGHAAIYLANADQDIACHTYCRCDQNNDYPQRWDSVGLSIYTLMKVR